MTNTAALVIVHPYLAARAEDVEDKWYLAKAAIDVAVEPWELQLATLHRQTVVPIAQVALETERRAKGVCVTCGNLLGGEEGSVCRTCAGNAEAAMTRKHQEEQTLRDRIRALRHAAEDAWFQQLPPGVFRRLAGRVPGAEYVDVISDAAENAWPRFLDAECRARHATHPVRIPTRVCGGCYLPLKSVLDPIADREISTCGPACDARVALIGDADYGTQCLWCNRWFRWDIPPDAAVTVPYCSPHCFWASPEDPEDPGVPRPWPATLYLPAPPATVGGRRVHGWPQAVATITWPEAVDAPPRWMAKGALPRTALVVLPAEAIAVGPEGLTGDVLLTALPGTAQGLAQRLGVPYRQVRRLLFQLAARGLIQKSEIIRATVEAGRPEIVWEKSES